MKVRLRWNEAGPGPAIMGREPLSTNNLGWSEYDLPDDATPLTISAAVRASGRVAIASDRPDEPAAAVTASVRRLTEGLRAGDVRDEAIIVALSREIADTRSRLARADRSPDDEDEPSGGPSP